VRRKKSSTKGHIGHIISGKHNLHHPPETEGQIAACEAANALFAGRALDGGIDQGLVQQGTIENLVTDRRVELYRGKIVAENGLLRTWLRDLRFD